MTVSIRRSLSQGLLLSLVSLASFGISSPLAAAEKLNSRSSFQSHPHLHVAQYIAQNRRTYYTAPPKRGTPRSEVRTNPGAGSRGDCQALPDRPPLTRLVGSPHLQQTVSDRPTIWIYNPYSGGQTTQASFSLQSPSGDQELYATTVVLPTSPGVIGIPIPDNVPALEADKTYVWFLSVDCPTTAEADPAVESDPAILQGTVRQVAASATLTQALDQALTPLDRVVAYGEAQIWYDLLDELARFRLAQPNNAAAQATWLEILSDEENVGLATVAEEVLVQIVAPE